MSRCQEASVARTTSLAMNKAPTVGLKRRVGYAEEEMNATRWKLGRMEIDKTTGESTNKVNEPRETANGEADSD